jgi:hypothetical protein
MKRVTCQYYYGCWWRRNIGDAIAVTIIATGFDIEQQMEL